MLALNVLRQYTKCHVLIVRYTYSKYAHGRPSCDRRDQRGPMHTPAPRALALRTSGVTYPGGTEQIRAVRADLRRLLGGCPMADDVILCASELAANAAIHSHSRLPGGSFTVRAKISPGDYAWIEVEDNGGPWTHRRGPEPAPRARHRPRPRHRLRHRRRPHRPHHLGPLRLARRLVIRRAPVCGVRTFFTVIFSRPGRPRHPTRGGTHATLPMARPARGWRPSSSR